MNFNALRLFLHVMRRGSLGAAANELNMSASGASRLLAGLERETGLILFSRDRQRLTPTAEGEQYFRECHRVLTAVDDLPRAARRLAQGTRPQLRLLSMTRVNSSLTVPAIARLLRVLPDVEIDLQIVSHYGIEAASGERWFDVAVGPIPLRHTAVDIEPLFDMPATVIMRRDHALAKRPFLRVRDLAGQRLVVAPPGAPMRDDVEAMFAAEGIPLRPQITASFSDLACQLVLRTNAITILEPLVPLTFNAKAFAIVPIKPPRTLPVGIITPALKPESRLIAQFKTAVREEANLLQQRLSRHIGKLNRPDTRRVSKKSR